MVIVVMGPAGAGKTTVGRALAAALGWAYLEGDDFHTAANRARMAAGHPLDDAARAPWLAALAAAIARHLAAGEGAVLACSALRRAYREALVPPRPERDVRFVYLRAPAAVLAARLATRAGHYFPPALLDSQLATLEEPGPDEPVLTVDATHAPAAIVADIVRRIGLAPLPGR